MFHTKNPYETKGVRKLALKDARTKFTKQQETAMRIADTQWIPTAPHQTWEALTDPKVLQQCLPGCIRVTQLSPCEYSLTVRAKVGKEQTDYEGEILLSDVVPAQSATLAFEGMGAAAGLAIGTAQITLSEKAEGTRLNYTVAAMAGGKLAEMGEAAIVKGGSKIVDKFFEAFIDYMGRQPRVAPPPAPPEPEEQGISNSRWSWVLAGVVVALLVGYHMLYR
jgi:carbon monoxide dehydrogenase subunit G